MNPETGVQLLEMHLLLFRKNSVLIAGSGNRVHYLGMPARNKPDGRDYGYDWSQDINTSFKTLISDGNHQALVNQRTRGREAGLTVPAPDHYLTLLQTLELMENRDHVSSFNDMAVGGSLSMTSVKLNQGTAL